MKKQELNDKIAHLESEIAALKQLVKMQADEIARLKNDSCTHNPWSDPNMWRIPAIPVYPQPVCVPYMDTLWPVTCSEVTITSTSSDKYADKSI